MSALAELRSAPRFAADIETALTDAGWRDRVAWPVGLAESNRIGRAQARAALRWLTSLDDRLLRDALLLALPNILSYGRAIVLSAAAADRTARSAGSLLGSAPEYAYLQDGGPRPPARAEPTLPPAALRYPALRRLARLRTWSGPARLAKALLRPDAVAVSHNGLLRAVAARSSQAIGFRHAETILDRARRRLVAAPNSPDAGPALARVVVQYADLAEPYRRRALDLIEALIGAHLDKAFADMAALRSAPLPKAIWTGSGGLYAPRAIGLEVLRRGGTVTRFDHGTPREFVGSSELTALLELAVSSEFVLATAGAADICRGQIDEELQTFLPPVAIAGADGDPLFARFPARRRRQTRNGKLRVVYAPTQLLGFRQLLPALPPDVVYLDWQLRVAEALRELPVDLICQPHPEGLLKNRPHPLEAVAPTIRGHFDAQLEAADVFIFDCPTTTALWQAVCTDARIVYLDIGSGAMTPPVAAMFDRRARRIEITCDGANRPVLDRGALREAVLGEHGEVDPFPLRRLLAGER